jgi:hypothetical protein
VAHLGAQAGETALEHPDVVLVRDDPLRELAAQLQDARIRVGRPRG